MKELDRINNFTKCKVPETADYGFFIVENIDNPLTGLNVLKEVITDNGMPLDMVFRFR